MISRDELAQEYIKIINNYYPLAGKLLRHCLVKIIKVSSGLGKFETLRGQSKGRDIRDRNKRNFYYLGIYYPHHIGRRLLEQQDIFKDAAENMGLVEVVFLNANNLVKDPHSKIRQQDFRFWLELCWIAQE